ncbi:serine/threonine-protein kinase [soil metagenome]
MPGWYIGQSMNSALDDVRRALAGEYDIQRLLGRGGMATVYLAEDLKRDGGLVAVKVLEPDLAGSVGHGRFLREIKIASTLTHPGILTVQDSGESEGLVYYVMPYVDGESLRERLDREKQLPIDDAVAITTEVADALNSAHGQGFIHRDIKPENIMLAGGHALVTDFGIARAVEQAGGEKLTDTGLAVGPPAYMSPEQWASDKVDGRSDLYALACVTYEMLVGEPPFTGPTAQIILARHSMQEVPSLRISRATIPAEVDEAVRRALAKAPADRFTSTGEFARALTSPPDPKTSRSLNRTGSTPAASPSRRRLMVAMASIVLLLVAGAGWFVLRGGAGGSDANRSRIVVLPFRNVGAPEDQYFSDGMTEEVTSRLSSIASLGVIARTSAMQYRDTKKSVQEIGKELGVGHLIEGSVKWDRSAKGRPGVRITITGIRTSDGTQEWSLAETVEVADVFALQARVAEEVLKRLDEKLMTPEKARLSLRPTEDMTAYDYYLRGNSYYNKSWERRDVDSAIVMYERATQQDPKFAVAWAALGKTHTWKHRLSFDETPERLAMAREAIAKAVQLGPNLPETHIAQGLYYYWGEWKFEQAIDELRKARSIQPSNAWVYLQLGNIRRRQGQWLQAIQEYEKAGEFDPRFHVIWFNIGHVRLHIREYDQAEPLFERALTLQPTFLDAYLMKMRLIISKTGDGKKARQWLDSTVKVVPPERWRLIPDYWLSGQMRIIYPSPAERLSVINAGRFGLDSSLALLSRAEAFTELGVSGTARATTDSAQRSLEALYARTPKVAWVSAALGVVYAMEGKKTEAVTAAKRAEALMPDALDGPGWIANEARVQMMVGNKSAALDALELVLKIPSDISVQWLKVDPTWAPLRGEPRFAALIARGSPPVVSQ